MAKTITTRLPDEFVSGLGKIAKIENLDTSTVVRKLLAKAIEEWEKNYALEKYKNNEFSLEEASRFSDITPWEFFDLLKQKRIPINYDLEELEAELSAIKWKNKKQ